MTHSFEHEPPQPPDAEPVVEPLPQSDVELDAPPRPRFYPVAFILAIVSWLVIMVLMVLEALGQHEAAVEAAKPGSPESDVHILLMRSEAKRLVGIRALAAGSGSADNQQIFDQAKTLFAGSIDQRLRFVVLAGELAGPQEALNYLDKLDALVAKQGTPYNGQQQFQHDTLRELYGDYRRLRYEAPSVTDSQRAKLREELGWFGQLALVPAGLPGFADAIVAEAGGPPALDVHDACPDPQARHMLVQAATAMAVSPAGARRYRALGRVSRLCPTCEFCDLVTIAQAPFRCADRHVPRGGLCGDFCAVDALFRRLADGGAPP